MDSGKVLSNDNIAKKNIASGENNKENSRKNPFSTYVYKVLKQCQRESGISQWL